MSLLYGTLAGICAAFSALFAKVTFGEEYNMSYRAVFLFGFIVCNIIMWWAHSRALAFSENSIKVVAINTGVNFFFTGILGWLFLSELHSLMWWFGLFIIFIGSVLVAYKPSDDSNAHNE
ncbi:hypothetical protein AB6A40_009576 [Gnathostoma spinigerum]|uniref:EamA domain-containing protein n=1 Tax=Gnathostoma spinigerum TaxID=75299 RepID=A0ABD6F128_9BILA